LLISQDRLLKQSLQADGASPSQTGKHRGQSTKGRPWQASSGVGKEVGVGEGVLLDVVVGVVTGGTMPQFCSMQYEFPRVR